MKQIFDPSILNSLEKITAQQQNGYGNSIVIEHEDINPVGGSKVPPAPMMFLPIPPNAPTEQPPSSSTVWVKNFDAYNSAKEGNQTDIVNRIEAQAQVHLDNLMESRKQVDKACRDMLNVPPLILLISPSSLSHGMTKLIMDGTFTRSGYVREHWGENLDTISCDGKIGAFYGVSTIGGYKRHPISISRSYRKSSLSYQNLMSLVMLYENNGKVFADFQDRRRITMVGSIMMFWDGVTYVGNFNSFSISDKEEAPFNLSYSFEFTVSKIIDIAR